MIRINRWQLLTRNHFCDFITGRNHDKYCYLPHTWLKHHFSTIRDEEKHRISLKSISTIPNAVTLGRILVTPVISVLMVNGNYDFAVALCAAGAISDWLDGFLARKLKQESAFGALFDPTADKIFVAGLAISVGLAGLLPPWFIAIVVTRDAMLLSASFLYRAIKRPKGSPYFSVTDSGSFSIQPSLLSKANTVLQYIVIGSSLLLPAISGHPVLASQLPMELLGVVLNGPMCYVTATTTIVSTLMYLNGSAIKNVIK